MQRTLIEKVTYTRTVKTILNVLTEQYLIAKADKLLHLMKEITDFSTEESIEKLKI